MTNADKSSKTFICNEVFPGCSYVGHGKDDTEVLIDTARHMSAQHNVRELSPEFLRKLRSAVREEHGRVA